MNSPLGSYAQIVAVVVVLGTIGAYLFALLTGNAAAQSLDAFATLAFGAVLGSAATIQGQKRDIDALQTRLDKTGAPPARNG